MARVYQLTRGPANMGFFVSSETFWGLLLIAAAPIYLVAIPIVAAELYFAPRYRRRVAARLASHHVPSSRRTLEAARDDR